MKIFVNKSTDDVAYFVDGKYYPFFLNCHEPITDGVFYPYAACNSKAPYSREVTLSQLQELCK
jgi:hypothetical protein